jgi:hypothetical protein
VLAHFGTTVARQSAMQDEGDKDDCFVGKSREHSLGSYASVVKSLGSSHRNVASTFHAVRHVQ